MNSIDKETLREWIDLDLDGQLSGGKKSQLTVQLQMDPELQQEHHLLESLHGFLDSGRIPVRPQFRDRVMESLPPAAWEKHPQAGWAMQWGLPTAMILTLMLAATVTTVGMGSAVSESHAFGIGVALFDFLQTTVLAGAGLLFATWRGVGFGLEEFFVGSEMSLLAFAVPVLFINLLLVLMLRRKPQSATVALKSTDDESRFSARKS